MLNHSGGHINPRKLSNELARLCATSDVQVFKHPPATAITPQGDSWLITTPEGGTTAKAVLLATNAYTGQNIEPRIARSMLPLRAYQLATEPLSEAQWAEITPARESISDTRCDLWYFRYTSDHRLVTGVALPFKAGAKFRLQALLKSRLETAFPSLAQLSFSHVWNGFVGITADFTPRFHELGPNYYSFTGYNGRGLALTLPIDRAFAR